jgi:hypothetical protein
MTENKESRVEINAENFPDEVFREYIERNFDKDKDGFLSEDEICNVREIDVSKKSIRDLKGLEYFVCLVSLNCCLIEIQELDVSQNISLERLDCCHTRIKELDVSENISLKELNCTGTRIQELDVSKNIWLRMLSCDGTKIQELDVSKNTDLSGRWDNDKVDQVLRKIARYLILL